jgi:hypothetical protein
MSNLDNAQFVVLGIGLVALLASFIVLAVRDNSEFDVYEYTVLTVTSLGITENTSECAECPSWCCKEPGAACGPATSLTNNTDCTEAPQVHNNECQLASSGALGVWQCCGACTKYKFHKTVEYHLRRRHYDSSKHGGQWLLRLQTNNIFESAEQAEEHQFTELKPQDVFLAHDLPSHIISTTTALQAVDSTLADLFVEDSKARADFNRKENMLTAFWVAFGSGLAMSASIGANLTWQHNQDGLHEWKKTLGFR